MRAVLGILAGLVVGVIVTILIGIIGVAATFSSPGPVALSNPQQTIDIFVRMPPGAKIALALAWFAGALAGAAIARRIARRRWAAWAVTALIAAYVLLNVLVVPLPGWMQALAVAAPLIGGLIGGHLFGGSADAAAPDIETPPEA